MGFLDDVQASISRGTEAVGRGTKNTQLKMKMDSLLKERQGLAAQLGAALYEKCKDMPEMRMGAEALFDGIAAIDAQRADIQAQMDDLTAQAQASQAAAMVYTCPGCGARVSATDLFCSGCGKPIAEVKAAAPTPAASPVPPPAAQPGPVCPSCGAAMGVGDLFCMSCGFKLDAPATAPAPDFAPVAPVGAAPVPPAGVPADAVAAQAPHPDSAATNETDAAPILSEGEYSQGACDAVDAQQDGEAHVAQAEEAQAAQASAVSCPSCGANVAVDDAFCGVCGAKLEA